MEPEPCGFITDGAGAVFLIWMEQEPFFENSTALPSPIETTGVLYFIPVF